MLHLHNVPVSPFGKKIFSFSIAFRQLFGSFSAAFRRLEDDVNLRFERDLLYSTVGTLQNELSCFWDIHDLFGTVVVNTVTR